VRRWQEIILGVAKEEMGHLMTVQNVLTALVSSPLLGWFSHGG
jgi:rubrerythrin